MVYETRKQSMVGVETDYSKYTHSMEDKMAAEAFGGAGNYGGGFKFPSRNNAPHLHLGSGDTYRLQGNHEKCRGTCACAFPILR